MGRGAFSSQPRSSLFWFILILIPAAIVVLQYDLLSLGSRSPEKEGTFSTSASTTEDEESVPVQAVQRPDKPLSSNSQRATTKTTSSSKAYVGETTASSSRTCEGEDHAVNEDGEACMPDLQWAISRSLIYVADKPPVNYMVCAIPKNGCTYHLAMINRIYGESSYQSTAVVHDVNRKNVYKLAARDTPTIARMLSNASIPKYLVVRNPLQRTMSAYLNKVEFFLPEEDRTVEHFHEWIYEEFPKGLPIDRSWFGMNPHWIPQMQFCGFRTRDVHSYFKVFKVEEPKGYVDFMYKIIPNEYLRDGWGEEENLNFRDHVLGPRTRTEGTSDKFKEYWNNLEVFDHMTRVLSLDIKMFGYQEDVARMRESLEQSLSQ